MMLDYMTYAAFAVLIILFLASAIRVLREYERGVIFTLGRFTGVKGPGLIILIPVVQQMVKVDLRVMTRASNRAPISRSIRRWPCCITPRRSSRA